VARRSNRRAEVPRVCVQALAVLLALILTVVVAEDAESNPSSSYASVAGQIEVSGNDNSWIGGFLGGTATTLVVNANDEDGDGIGNPRDNCPGVYNPEQADAEMDGKGARFDSGGEALCDDVDNRFGLSSQNTARQNTEALIAAMSGTSMYVTDVSTGETAPICTSVNRNQILLPPGDYLIENAAPPNEVLVRCFGGSLTMKKTHDGVARFVFTNSNAKGIRWELADGARFVGVTTKLDNPPKRINSYEMLTIANSTDPYVEDLHVDGSAAAGLYISNSVRPRVVGARIFNTMADGLHFANSTDAYVEDLETRNTGDDGLAFFKNDSNSGGGFAKNVRVRDSDARGIAVIGQRDVEVSDFRVEDTDGNGIQVAEEPNYSSALPANVYFHDGEVHHAGCLEGNSSQGYSVFYNGLGPDVRFANVSSFEPLLGSVGTNRFDGLTGEPSELGVLPRGTGSCGPSEESGNGDGGFAAGLLRGIAEAVREVYRTAKALLPASS
jgi:hypothetical protein